MSDRVKLDARAPEGWVPGETLKEEKPGCKHVWAELSGPDDPFDRNKNSRRTALVRCIYCRKVALTQRKQKPEAPLPANPRTGY